MKQYRIRLEDLGDDGWLAYFEEPNIKGMVEHESTAEEAVKELFLSLKIKEDYDSRN